ncbi:hypothetical protein BCR37DRAFT_275681 [Protomyces lactucae-debilis]|uniref:Mpv17/PMP22 family protein n=1 Tax=Protomyces lactucae-debilis TaxID=2754530 RepID=A0A1Y2FJ86_PROLT|nr:uncharacterized protein BCR37DRAFT_275681 [Protomyces lactucae-debilis]ORY83667.1 hypothetical protein BCR37DRAFT_275681 [Protomyces lactucae-debilis]
MVLKHVAKPFRTGFASYQAALLRRPLTVQLSSGTALVLLGDFIAQKLIERKPDYDWKRASVMVALRGIFHSGAIIAWYRFLNTRLAMPNATRSRRMFTHLFLDQAFFGPSNVIFFFVASGILEGKSKDQISEKLQDRGLATVASAWCVWVPFQAIMFRFVPAADQRLILGQTLAIGWNGYMSYANANRSKALQVRKGGQTPMVQLHT